MKEQIIITPCLLEGGKYGAIVATSSSAFPISMPVDNVGKFVQDIFDQFKSEKEDSKKPTN